MSKKEETLFKERVIKDLRTLPLFFFDKIQQVARRGSPDIYACLAGTFIAIELKKDEFAKVDELQWYILTMVANAGGLAYLCYPENWEATFLVLKALAAKAEKKLGQPAWAGGIKPTNGH